MKKEPVTERILIVDDDPDLLSMLKEALAKPGRHIDLVHTRMAAEAALASVRYNLIIADIYLPDTTLLELVDTIREIDLDYPVILMSGMLGDAIRDAEGDTMPDPDFLRALADRRGVRALLEKPFDLRKLLDTVERVLEEYR